VDWNTGGYYDIHYPVAPGNTNCAANEHCSINPFYIGKYLSTASNSSDSNLESRKSGLRDLSR
jgi:hypothetical protein